MNAVEIEEAVSELASAPFDAAEFPYAFLAAFGNKATTIARLRSGSSNASDVPGGVLQRNNLHLAVCEPGNVSAMLAALRASAKTAKGKVKFIVATDGVDFEAEDMGSGEPLACAYAEFADRFGFFLPLAGITTVREVKNNPIDIKATGRLNKLYVELITKNPDWDTDARRHDLNQFMARLIFCFFAEDTGIFLGDGLFTQTVNQMSDATNTHDVICELFRAMDIAIPERQAAKLRPWADAFPHVNGGLFTGSRDVPRFSKIARAYLLRIGELDWKHINPDIFGSMIQGIADDEERGSLGMHYTSVPNILKVLDPLFLDDLREKLDEAGDNQRKLLNLRKRIASIRVFDPACGSGNFLVIAYIKMREIEAEIIRRRNDEKKSGIPLTNFYGIEIKDFACETARLSLLIAEFQCDARLIGQREACLNVLPLKKTGQIHCGNALRMDWLRVCPPIRPPVMVEYDPSSTEGHRVIGNPPEGLLPAPSETYVCGNPPYQGSVNQTDDQKADMSAIFANELPAFKDLDYVTSWFVLASRYIDATSASSAFVATNSICQGEQVAMLWPLIFRRGVSIVFAHRSFLWKNNAANNAGVTCIVVGLSKSWSRGRVIYDGELRQQVASIGPYLTASGHVIVTKRSSSLCGLPPMVGGNQATDGGNFSLSNAERTELLARYPEAARFVKRFMGSYEFINGVQRWCIWIPSNELADALKIEDIETRISAVRRLRTDGRSKQAKDAAAKPHRFVYAPHRSGVALLVPKVSSERREYLPCGVFDGSTVISDLARVIYDAPLWSMAVVASRVHLVWIATVCGKLKTDFRYSNTLGWNTFPLPPLTEKNKADLARCTEEILLAREAHFPASIAELYEPNSMPEDLRRAHDKNDETLERIYIGRRFKNDTERLEKLFDLYSKMTSEKPAKQGVA